MADGTERQPLPGSEGQIPPPDLEMEAQELQPGQVGEGGRQPVVHGDHHYEQMGQLSLQTPGQGNQVPQQTPPVQHGQLVPRVPVQGYPFPQQAPSLQHGDHHYRQTGVLQTPQFPQQAAPLQLYHPSQQGYSAPTAMIHRYRGFPMAPQPAGQVHYNVPPPGPEAANIGGPPALQMGVGVGQVGGVFGGATIRIQDQAIAKGGLAGALVGAAAAAGAFAAGKVCL
ncbi:calcium-binding protein P-like [Branchiostoma floridae]|uniref:Calcium-binding protein P-like n=1 Tax=Branchiostoma floridae TaxID=7739 RepID=A0A9J7HWI0_BRAFL|nr:calcium-binding protein P-like [Branchiostoma floridae]